MLYRTEHLAFVQFRTKDWPGYKDFSNYARVALFPKHLRPTDPQSPGVMNFVQALASEASAQQQPVSNSRHLANVRGANDKEKTISKKEKEQGAPSPRMVKSPPAVKLSARLRELSKGRVNGKECRSLRPVRTIAGLAVADFIYDR